MKALKYFPLIFLFSCNSSESSNEAVEDGSNISEDTMKVDSIGIDEIVKLPFIDPDKDYKGNILQESEYHGDEVMDDVNELEWWGLFRKENGDCYVEIADITAEKVNDGILDEPGQKTGWGINVAGKDYPVLLINDLDFIHERDVKEFKLENNIILPGEERTLYYEGAEYTFSATGNEEGNEDYTYITHYELHMSYSKDGEEKKQTLVHIDYFDDSIVQILFIGDIDGDGILDLIVNNSYHYNVYLPTLYLSRPAKEGEVVNKVAEHQSVGC